MSKRRGWKRTCYLCGETDNVLWTPGTVAMCLHCEGHHEDYEDTPVADSEPDYCPYCGSDDELVEPMFGPDDDDVDEERAIANGIDPDTADFDEIAPYMFGYDYVYCENCNHALYYGKRMYWNPTTGNYTEKRPVTPQEVLEAERLAQEAAGQLRLFDSEALQ